MPYRDEQLDNHTCPLVWEYHTCPKCKKITESRQAYKRFDDGSYRKKVACKKCHETFEVSKILKPLLG